LKRASGRAAGGSASRQRQREEELAETAKWEEWLQVLIQSRRFICCWWEAARRSVGGWKGGRVGAAAARADQG